VSRAQTANTGRMVRVLTANHPPIVRHGLLVLLTHEPNLERSGETEDLLPIIRH
jgi:hypothetical protein